MENITLLPKFIRETSEDVVKQMLDFSSFSLIGYDILEPSAGKGILLDYLTELTGITKLKKHIDCVELNKENREILKEKGYNVVGSDFLKVTLQDIGLYNFIIATPTYKDNVDVEHIMHMYQFLHDGGILVSLTHPDWTTHNSDRQRKFREWLEDKDYEMKMLNDFSYVEKFETQPSMMIKITK